MFISVSYLPWGTKRSYHDSCFSTDLENNDIQGLDTILTFGLDPIVGMGPKDTYSVEDTGASRNDSEEWGNKNNSDIEIESNAPLYADYKEGYAGIDTFCIKNKATMNVYEDLTFSMVKSDGSLSMPW